MIDARESHSTLTDEPAGDTAAAHRLDAFFAGFAPGRQAQLLLDYDGTLAPIRVDRFRARPWAGVREVLNNIQAQGSTRIVFITGRPAHEIAPLLQVDFPLDVWGLHGAEHLFPDGRRELELPPPATLARLEELKHHLRRDALGGLFEDKANGAVMHWRGLTRPRQEQVERRTRALFEPLARLEGLSLLKFEAGLELRAGRDKGGAVEAALAGAPLPGQAAYLGDDLTDEAAFRAVNSLGSRGLSALVRRAWRQTDARVWLRPPTDLLAFLKRWADVAAQLR